MKVLIVGKGWISNQFLQIIDVPYQVSTVRANELAFEQEVEEYQPTHVVSFIGRTHGNGISTIDYLEDHLFENVRDNLFAPLWMAEICKRKNIHFTYLGTGCIFKYDGDQLFNEDSNPNFFGSSYSVVKGFTDQWMRRQDVLNLRIRMPITDSSHPRNFITKITTYDKICSIPNSMSVLPELLPYVLDMMKRKITGTMNLTNPGVISHNEILQMYKDIVDPLFTWKNFSQEQQRAILASDRSNNHLDTTRLESMYPVKPIHESVRECLVKYKESITHYRLLITGGCGFIGSNFINYYTNRPSVQLLVNLDAMYYCANELNVKEEVRNSSKYVFIKGNILQHDLVSHILERYQITHVIHFAAQSHVQNSFEDSIKFTHDNVVGTHTLLECCRKYGKIQKFIHVSTDEVYGESMLDVHEKHKTEHTILCPTNPYAATKAAAELIAQSYNHSYKMPIIITRGNNVYGPHQYPEKIIPLFIQQLKTGQKITIQGDGTAVRAFLHALDTARAFECILEKGALGEIYNIGCDENMEYSVLDVAKILIELIHNTTHYEKWIEFIEDRPYNDKRYYISNEKLKELGWIIQTQFKDGLKELINTI